MKQIFAMVALGAAILFGSALGAQAAPLSTKGSMLGLVDGSTGITKVHRVCYRYRGRRRCVRHRHRRVRRARRSRYHCHGRQFCHSHRHSRRHRHRIRVY